MMKRFTLALVCLFVFTAVCLAGSSKDFPWPAPAISGSGIDKQDFALSYTLGVKDSNMNLGNGADLAYTRYFSRRFGLTAAADLMNVNAYSLREFGVRGGPVVRFMQNSRYRPFVHALAGLSEVSADYTRPLDAQGHFTGSNRPWKAGASVLAGGGFDTRISGSFFARVGADFVEDFQTPYKTRYVRGTIGFSYHPGAFGR